MQSTKVTTDPLYTVEFTFHAAKNVPVADFPGFTADPFLECQLAVPAQPNTADNPLTFRSHTVHRTLNPVWESKWRVAGLPHSGFKLTIRLRDEDPGDHDDRLGTVLVRENSLHENLFRDHQEYNVKKTRGSVRSYILTYVASAVSKHISIHARLYLSIKVIGETPNQADRRVYTVGPHWWSVHYSPLIGKLTGTRGPDAQETSDPCKPAKIITVFQANKFQLGGPVPEELRHHFVGYRPIIERLFKKKSLRGRILRFGLRRQYTAIYYYSRSTECGVIDTETSDQDEVNSTDESTKQQRESAQAQLATRFLEMTQWGEGGRVYTYVITLDGEWRFTETGPEFAINMLSKHSMHSNVAPEVAFSGEFFVQKLASDAGTMTRNEAGGRKMAGPSDVGCAEALGENCSATPPHQQTKNEQPSSSAMHAPASPSSEIYEGTGRRDPKHYELVIDNSSGTYRSKKELLPVLGGWLSGPTCLGGLGAVQAMDHSDNELIGMREKRAHLKAEEKKRRGEPQPPVFAQAKGPLPGKQMKRIGVGQHRSVSSADVDGMRPEVRRARESQGSYGAQQDRGNRTHIARRF